MEIKRYDYLPNAARQIREKVFVEEQGFQEEFDGADEISTHLLVFDGEKAVATCRYYFNKARGGYLVGRIAVLKECRGKKIGALMMKTVQEYLAEIGENRVYLHAQERAAAFYLKQGFAPTGEKDEEEDCPHIWMIKEW